MPQGDSMSEKWKVHPDMLGSLVTIRDSKSMPIADGRNSSYAQQIAREHNAVPALVEALRGCLVMLEHYSETTSNLDKPGSPEVLGALLMTVKNAQDALALAEENQ